MRLDYEKWSDEDLMGAYQRGDDLAFNTLYERHKRRVQGILSQKIYNRSMADDVLQDIFNRVVNSRMQFDPAKSFKKWFNQLANNAVIDHLRKLKTAPTELQEDSESQREKLIDKNMTKKYTDELTAEEELEVENDKTEPDEKIVHFKTEKFSSLDLNVLSDIQRRAVELRFIEDLEFDEIGKDLNVSSANARKILNRAIQLLRKGRT